MDFGLGASAGCHFRASGIWKQTERRYVRSLSSNCRIETKRVPSPGLDQPQSDHSAIKRFQDVEGRWITAAGGDAVLKRRMLIHEILDGQLNADVSQILVGR